MPRPATHARFALGLLCLALALAPGCADDRGGADAGPGGGGGADAGPGGGASDGGSGSTDAGGGTGGGGIGAACAVDADCTDPPDAMCLTDVVNPLTGDIVASFPGGFCTKACEETSDCGSGEDVVCVSQSMSGGGSSTSSMLCTTSCDTDADCRQAEGYRCATLFGFGYCTQ